MSRVVVCTVCVCVCVCVCVSVCVCVKEKLMNYCIPQPGNTVLVVAVCPVMTTRPAYICSTLNYVKYVGYNNNTLCHKWRCLFVYCLLYPAKIKVSHCVSVNVCVCECECVCVCVCMSQYT